MTFFSSCYLSVCHSNFSLITFLPRTEAHLLEWAPWRPLCFYLQLPSASLGSSTSSWPQPHRQTSSTSFTIATSNSVPLCYCTSLYAVETTWNIRSQAEVLCDGGRNFIVEVGLHVRIAYLTTAWKTSPLFIRDPIHQSPLTLTTDNLATRTFVNYPPYFIPGSEVTEEQVLSFSSSLSKEGCLFVYGLCYLVIRTKGKGKRCVCGGST